MDTFDDRRPFRRSSAVAAGVSDDRLYSSRYRRVVRGVWVRSESWTSLSVLDAGLLLHPVGAVATHFSAARCLGLPVPEHPFEHITVRRSADRRYRREIKCHVTQREVPVVVVDGRRVSHPLKTFVDLAGWLSLVDLVVLGDAVVRLPQMSSSRLLAYCRSSSDAYAGLARRAAEYVRDGVDSAMETRLRMLIVLAGLPEPVVDHHVVDQHGRVRRRLDLSYPEVRLALEYDGRHHIAREEQWHDDLARREELEDDRWKVLVFTARDVFAEPEQALERVRQNLIARGVQVPPLRPTWAQHFAA